MSNRHHRTALRLTFLLTLALTACPGFLAPCAAQDVAGMAPGRPASAGVEAILPQILRASHGAPYDVAAIRFGPEFWQAMGRDARRGGKANMLQALFSGNLLFGVGPLETWLDVAMGSGKHHGPTVRWAAPPTMRAALHIMIDQVELVVVGQRADWVRRLLPDTDAVNLFNQLELIAFPLMGGGQSIPADLARSMTLVVGGLSPGTTQTFTWSFETPQALAMPPVGLVVPRGRGQLGPAQGGGGGLGGAGLAGGVGGAGGRGGGAGAAVPEAAMGGPVPGALGVAPGGEPGPAPRQDIPMQTLYPEAHAASTIGLSAFAPDGGFTTQAFGLAPSSVEVNQLVEDAGHVILDYRMSPIGRQDVSVLTRDGQVVDRLKAGPAPPDGQEEAPWRPPVAKGEADGGGFFFAVRNTVDGPQGTQISEAVVPIPKELHQASQAANAQAVPPLTDLLLSDMSVVDDVLTARAKVAPTLADQDPGVPALQVRITREDGDLVKEFLPTPPALGRDYVFVWDCTDQKGERVPDGRYLLRVGLRVQSDQGTALSEVRYWVDVPLARTAKRLAILGPAVAVALQPRLAEAAGGKQTFAYVLPVPGRVTISVIDADGRVIRRLLDREVSDGPHEILWDACDDQGRPVSPGSYTVQFELDAGDRGAWGAVPVDLPVRGN